MEEEMIIEIIEIFAKYGYINKTKVRNDRIIKRFRFYRDQGMKMDEAEARLASEFFLDKETIHQIVYKK